ncbi:glycosyltransferase [Bacillus canaveralius]|uniref:glycosyltransferase n=1 Tax=Bacillus canaveralius TaxID=1403243 RepID=UPI000F76770F|nr:glycosyltransferase [Bacillus canaveralius]RSK53489.1 glycosyltransferase [Bacillus canaveralius]
MKKILFMVSSMNIGGVEKSLLSLLSVIPKERYHIHILVLEKKGGFLEYIPDWVKVEEATWFKKVKPVIMQPPQQTIKDFYKNKAYLNILPFIFSYFLSKQFNNRNVYYKQVLKNVPKNSNIYDVAIAYQGPTDIIDFYIANKVTATKKVSWVHFDVSKHGINERLYNKLYYKFNKIFVVSKEAKKRLIERIPEVESKADVLLNIIPNKLIKEMSKETVDFGSDYKGIKIVTVGRLSTEKGQDIAIKVLSRLRSEGYDVRWYCIGDGSQRKEFEMLIQKYDLINDFILLGATSNPYPYIAKADIYVQTSRHEGYCLTLAEAKCLHKPIVTTNFTGALEQLKDGYNGLIVKCDEDELFKKIQYLIDNPKQRDKLIQNLLTTDVDTTEQVYKLINYL